MKTEFSDGVKALLSEESLEEAAALWWKEMVACGSPPIPDLSLLHTYHRRTYLAEVEVNGGTEVIEVVVYMEWDSDLPVRLIVGLGTELQDESWTKN